MKKWGLRIGIPLVVLVGGGAVAYAGLDAGSPDAGSLFSFQDGQRLTAKELNANFQSLGQRLTAVEAAENATPSGAVMFFNLTTCPTGWTALAAAQGRYIVGLAADGGTLAGTDGTALSDLEDRPAGQHTHDITDPGHNHGLPFEIPGGMYSGAGLQSQPEAVSTVATGTSTTGVTVNSFGSVAGTNAPYIQLLACQKN